MTGSVPRSTSDTNDVEVALSAEADAALDYIIQTERVTAEEAVSRAVAEYTHDHP